MAYIFRIRAGIVTGLAALAVSCGGPDSGAGIDASGFIEATQIRVSAQIGGTVHEMFFEEGGYVEKGALLAVLERQDVEAQLHAAEAAMERAEAHLKDLEAGSRRHEIGQAEAALEQMQAQYEKARLDTNRYGKLYAQDAAPESMYDDVKSRIDIAQAQVRQAEQRLALLRAGSRPHQILAARAEVEQAFKSLDALRATYSYTQIAAPRAGLIQSKNAEAGELVTPGFPVYTILDPADLWVRVYIPETEIPRIKTGAKAEVVLDSFPGRVIPGTVSYIASEAEFTPRNVQTKKERVNLVFEVKIKIDNPDEIVKPGIPADITIYTGA